MGLGRGGGALNIALHCRISWVIGHTHTHIQYAHTYTHIPSR